MNSMSKIKLLLADDDRVIVTTMMEDLIDAGYDVVPAYNGEDAFEKCKTEAPDLAILDIRMPKMDGIEASKQIKASCETPFIFLTAYSDKDFIDQAVENGALGYLIKPVSAERMIPVIETALARARDLSSAVESNKNLIQAMETRREIDIAIGIIMERNGLIRRDAFETLRLLARSNRRKVESVASSLIEASETLAISTDILSKVNNKNRK